jgi:type II secretory pathway pseudopilin PulG
MKKIVAILLIAVGAASALWAAKTWTRRQLDQNVARFNVVADNLILSLQQYREFVGCYPTGNNASITKDLLGRGEKKVVILSARNHSEVNEKGEIVDPWGTPIQFYFSDTEVLIRSAGPNRIWEDTAVPFGDDLYRTASKAK